MTDLRDAQQDVTRNRIVGAVRDLLGEAQPGALSVVAVAERAGVSRRTVYRHFPTKDALVAAVAHLEDDRARGYAAGRLLAMEDPTAFLLGLWPDMAGHPAASLAANATPAGREVRRQRTAQRRLGVGAELASRGVDPESEEGRRFVALMLLLTGSTTLHELVDIHGLAVEDAARTVGWLLQLMIKTTEENR